MAFHNRILFVLFICCSCSSSRSLNISKTSRLQLFGLIDIPQTATYHQTRVGGISGIDYDPVQNIYYLISDDPSVHNPSRFYRAQIDFTSNGIDSVRIIGVDTLKQSNGRPFPSSVEDKHLASDPESIRYDALRKQLVWTSEGERILTNSEQVLQDPGVHVTDMQGRELFTYSIPANFKASSEEKGARHNSSFEGISFANNNRHTYVAMEAPLIQDGALAGTGDSSAIIRIIRYDAANGSPLAQYAYRIDPVAIPPNPPGSFKINGITEILWVEKEKLLVVERSFSTGKQDCIVKIYLADLSTGKDMSGVSSFIKEKPILVKKELLLNMASLGIFIDNIEGICRGPELPDGRQSLVMVADNNFSQKQRSQLLVFAID